LATVPILKEMLANASAVPVSRITRLITARSFPLRFVTLASSSALLGGEA